MIDMKLLKKLFRDNDVDVSVNRSTRTPGFGNPTSGIALNLFGSSIMIRYTGRHFESNDVSAQNRNQLMGRVKGILNQYQIPFKVVEEGTPVERLEINDPDNIANPLEQNVQSAVDWDRDIIASNSNSWYWVDYPHGDYVISKPFKSLHTAMNDVEMTKGVTLTKSQYKHEYETGSEPVVIARQQDIVNMGYEIK